MARKDDIYYTFRVKSGLGLNEMLVVDVAKWDELEGDDETPVQVYSVKPDYAECSCPARVAECKHVRLGQELRKAGRLNAAYKWKWNERLGWVELDDMKEDFG